MILVLGKYAFENGVYVDESIDETTVSPNDYLGYIFTSYAYIHGMPLQFENENLWGDDIYKVKDEGGNRCYCLVSHSHSFENDIDEDFLEEIPIKFDSQEAFDLWKELNTERNNK